MTNNELYTITKQYHEKKGVDIWVVRLEARVDDDTFMELSNFAKELHRGYYSKFYGVNGFVFKTEEDAKRFGNKLDDYLQIEESEEDDNELELPEYEDFELETPKSFRGGKSEDGQEVEKNNNTEEEIPLDNFCTTLRLLVEDKGAKILSDTIHNTVDTLKGIGGFKDLPPSIEFILRTIIMKKYGDRMLKAGGWNSDCQELIDDFIFRTGFQKNLVQITFASIGKALNWNNVIISSNEEKSNNMQDLKPKEGKTPIIKRPSLRASNDTWSEYLMQLLVIKVYIPNDLIKTNISVRYDKEMEAITIYAELENMHKYDTNLIVDMRATIYNQRGVLDSNNIFISEEIDSFHVEDCRFYLKTKITNIEKIIISGDWNFQVEDDDE